MSKPIRRAAAALALHCLLLLGACDWLISAEKRIASAENRIAAGDDRGAAIDLQNALKAEPDNVRARVLLAEVSLRLGDPKSAEKELTRVSEHGAAADKVHPLIAEARLAMREFSQLLSLIDSGELVLQEPQRSTYRGLALHGSNELEPAIEAFDKALAADPNFAPARIGLAETRLKQGDSEAALKELQVVLSANPNDATAALLKGVTLARRGDYRLAADALNSAREHAAGQLSAAQLVLAFAAITEAQLALGDLPAARSAHAELAARAASSPLTGVLAARLAMAQQAYTVAVAEAQKVVTAVPDLVPAKMLLGAALLAQGNLNQAETQFAEVVRLAPENMEARKLLARVNLQLQRPDVVMQVLSPLQQSDVADPQLDALLGWAELQRGDDAAAIVLLERSVAAQPQNANLKLDLSMAYSSAGQHGKAVTLLRSVPATPGDMRRNSLLINSLAAASGVDAAREEIERMVAAAPQDAATLNLAGSFYARQGDFVRAKDLLARAVAKEPTNMTALTTQARVEMLAGDQQAAGIAVDKALSVNASDVKARLLQVEIAARSGDLATATKRLEEMRAKDAKAVEPRILLARIYLQQKDTTKADEVIREVHGRAQSEPVVAAALGRFYMDAGRFEEALSWFRSAAKSDTANPSHGMSVARAQFALGNNSAARETLETLLASHTALVSASAALVMLDLREGRREAAATRVADLRRDHPRDPSVALLQGDVAMSGKAYQDAAKAYASASELVPSGASAVRAYRARQLGGLPNATAPLEAWLQREPRDVAARMVLAEAYAADGQRGRAIEQYEQAVAAPKPNPMALNNLAWLYHEERDSRAAATAKRAFDAAPQVPAIADTYGWILVERGDVEQGLPILQKATQDSKLQPEIHYHYAVALARAGRREDARRELRLLTRSDAKFNSAADARKLLTELEG